MIVATKNLDALRTIAKAKVDTDAEVQRLVYITPGAGQSMVYDEKYAEAVACLADPSPTDDAYPLIAASLNLEGVSLADVADLVVATRNAWLGIAASIENKRLTAKAAIDAAMTPAAIDAAAVVVWA